MTKDAGPVGEREGHDDEIAAFHSVNIGSHIFDDRDGLVPHETAPIAVFHCLVRPKIAAADAGATHRYYRAGRFDDPGVGNGLDTNVALQLHA